MNFIVVENNGKIGLLNLDYVETITAEEGNQTRIGLLSGRIVTTSKSIDEMVEYILNEQKGKK